MTFWLPARGGCDILAFRGIVAEVIRECQLNGVAALLTYVRRDINATKLHTYDKKKCDV